MRMFRRHFRFGSRPRSNEIANLGGARGDFEWKRMEEYVASSSKLGIHGGQWQPYCDSDPFDYELQRRACLVMSVLKS